MRDTKNKIFTFPQKLARYEKKVIRLMDISLAGVGLSYEVSLECGELMLFADTPISVSIDDKTRMFTKINRMHLRGYVQRLYLGVGMWTAGRVVIYAGYPDLGPAFRPEVEDVWLKQRLADQNTAVWPLNTPGTNFTNWTVPGSLDNEAVYLWGFSMKRDQGNVASIEYIDSESGLSLSLFKHTQIGTSTFLGAYWETPIRLACSGAWWVYGALNANNTNLTYELLYSRV